jgi:hypothetical protein
MPAPLLPAAPLRFFSASASLTTSGTATPAASSRRRLDGRLDDPSAARQRSTPSGCLKVTKAQLRLSPGLTRSVALSTALHSHAVKSLSRIFSIENS